MATMEGKEMNTPRILILLSIIPLCVIAILICVQPEPLVYTHFLLFSTIILILLSYNSYIDKMKGKKK